MPLAALRLINPPGHRRKKPFPTYAAASRTSSNPKRKRAKPAKKSGGVKVPKKRKSPKRVAAGKAAWATRKRKAAKRSKTARKAATTRKVRKTTTGRTLTALGYMGKKRPKRKRRRKSTTQATLETLGYMKKKPAKRRKRKETTVPKKRKHKKAATPKKRKVTRKKRHLSHARAVAMGRKGGKAAARKRRAKKTHAKKAAPKRTYRRRRRRVERTVKTMHLKTRKGSRKRKTYKVKRRVRRGGVYKYRLTKRNPVSQIKSVLQTAGLAYVGFVAIRALNYQLKTLMDNTKNTTLTSYSKYLAPGASFLLATLALPRVMPGKFASALQYGALFALGDAILKAVVPTSTQTLLGLSDFGEFGGYNEYVPLREYTPEALQGTNVEEAMALDEYVEGMGAEVEEALASPGLSADEVQGFQTGYAGGSLAKSVFSS